MNEPTRDNKSTRPRNAVTDAADEMRRFKSILSPTAKLFADQRRLAESLRPVLKMTELANAQIQALKPISDVAKQASSLSNARRSNAPELARALDGMQATAKAVELVRNAAVHAPPRVENMPTQLAGITVQEPLARNALEATHQIRSARDIGRLIRARRKELKLSQQKFADLAGVGRRFISELENGKGTLEFDKVLKVTAAAGIDLSARRR